MSTPILQVRHPFVTPGREFSCGRASHEGKQVLAARLFEMFSKVNRLRKLNVNSWATATAKGRTICIFGACDEKKQLHLMSWNIKQLFP